MERNLYAQARENVNKNEKAEKRLKIRQEYSKLLYKSQMRKMDKSVVFRINATLENLKHRPVRGLGSGYMRHHVHGTLDDYLRKKQYHPVTLKEIEKYAKGGEWLGSFVVEWIVL